MSELELYKGMVKNMKNEIKEKMTIGKAKKILRGFLAKDCYYDTPLYYAIPYLLDYITNLQQENQELNEENEGLKIKLALKQFIKHTEMNFCKLGDELEDYKSRVEKAVEYINSGIGKSLKEEYCCFEILLNILNGKGSDK